MSLNLSPLWSATKLCSRLLVQAPSACVTLRRLHTSPTHRRAADTAQSSSHEQPISSVHADEVAKFSALASHWWDPSGPFRPLHEMNPLRVGYIRSALERRHNLLHSSPKPFDGLSILDIGCGGGILAEPLARLGGQVLGIDASEKNVKTAMAHRLRDQSSLSTLTYKCCTAEALAESGQQYDVVVASEIIEHVKSPNDFIGTCSKLLKPGGTFIVSTINRTPQAFVVVVVAAEYIARWVPPGTHDYEKFIKPEELTAVVREKGMELEDVSGMLFNPITNNWWLGADLSVNYILAASKPKASTA